MSRGETDEPHEPLNYVPNPKHKEPWQRGRRGSLCPREIDGEHIPSAGRKTLPC